MHCDKLSSCCEIDFILLRILEMQIWRDTVTAKCAIYYNLKYMVLYLSIKVLWPRLDL